MILALKKSSWTLILVLVNLSDLESRQLKGTPATCNLKVTNWGSLCSPQTKTDSHSFLLSWDESLPLTKVSNYYPFCILIA